MYFQTLASIIAFIALINVLIATSLTCSESSSCHSFSISDVATITCDGANSCHNLIVELTNHSTITCSGPNSCRNNLFIVNDTKFHYLEQPQVIIVDSISILASSSFINCRVPISVLTEFVSLYYKDTYWHSSAMSICVLIYQHTE